MSFHDIKILCMGINLGKVRSAILFRKKRFSEPYIKYNTEKRAFEKDFYEKKCNCFMVNVWSMPVVALIIVC